jgi:hypothetical protein
MARALVSTAMVRGACCCCCYRRRNAQPLVRAFGAVKHAQDKASQTARAGFVRVEHVKPQLCGPLHFPHLLLA